MKDHPVKGIALMAAAVLLIVVMNMFARIVSQIHNPVEIVFYRNAVALLLVLAVIGFRRDSSLLKTARLKDQILRATAGTAGLGLVFWAYALMPMADVVAVMFTAGLMTTGLSALWLKEKVGIYRWSAVCFGCIGALIIAAPWSGAWESQGILVALAAAFIGGAVVSTMLRSLGKTEPALTTVFYFLIIGLIMTAPYMAFQGHLPTNTTLWPLMACGIAGGVSLIMKTQAFRYAEASLLSPVHYTSIVWATLLGWLVLNEWPDANVFIGAALIIGSNLVVLWREKRDIPSVTKPL